MGTTQTQTPTNVMDAIITEHNTSLGRMHQHFGDKKIVITTDFFLKATVYKVNGEVKRFIRPTSDKALADIQQEAFEAWIEIHN